MKTLPCMNILIKNLLLKRMKRAVFFFFFFGCTGHKDLPLAAKLCLKIKIMQDQVFSFIKQAAKSIKERELLLIIYCVPKPFRAMC